MDRTEPLVVVVEDDVGAAELTTFEAAVELVVVDVVGDLRSCLFEGLPFGAPGAPFLELAEPRLDERLRFRVAVATAATATSTSS